ncbi:MAG TPA: glycosyltransferase [Pyrinomonadaceae bacterium]|nr:glycosyltransferase [Pyrinomonadaceae bacterium]
MTKPNPQIAHIMPWSSVGGTEHATLRLAQALRNHKYEHTIFCPELSGPVATMFAQAGFEIAEYTAIEPSYRHPRDFLSASRALSRELRKRGIDLVHCADLLAAYYAGLAGKLARLPVLCQIRCSYPRISTRDKTFLKAVEHFAFVSKDARATFDYKVSDDRATVIYDGIDVRAAAEVDDSDAVRRELGINTDATIIGMIARVAPAKDFPTLVRSAQSVVRSFPEVRFLIVGDHSMVDLNRRHYEEVRQLISESGLSQYFMFTDHRNDVERLLDAIDIFVLSTKTEGLPLVILEAMAHAKPVVATAVGGVPELVRDKETGFLHSLGDYEAQANQLSLLVKDKVLRHRLGEAGRALAQSDFSRERFATEVSNLYSRLLGEPELTSAELKTNNSLNQVGRHV